MRPPSSHSKTSVSTTTEAAPAQAHDADLQLDARSYGAASVILFRIAVEPRGRFRFESVNGAFLEATGLMSSQIVGRLVQEVIPEPSCSFVLKHYRRAVRTKATVRWEETTHYPTGIRQGEVAVTPLRDARGRITHLTGVVHDITARKDAENALHESEKRYRQIVQTAEEGIWTINAASLTDYVNPKMARMMGYKPEEMLGRPIDDFLDDEGRRMLKRLIKRRKGGVAEQFEFKYVRKDGSYLLAFVSTNPIHDSHGNYIGAMALLTDISARKKAEASYQRELEFNETLLRHTSALIVLLDREGRMVHLNEATLATLGYTRKELLGRTPREVGILNPVEAMRAKERLGRLLDGKTNTAREAILTDKKGRDHIFSLTSAVTRSPSGEIDRIIVTGTDLTERHRLQREVLRISEQEQARIGHDLHDGVGQTMTGISILMDSLEAELQGDQKASARRISQLLRDAFQEVRRISHGLSPDAVQNRGLGGALKLLAETIRLNHRKPCLCEIDERLQADPEISSHVFRIAQEAASNALRHGTPKKISISLSSSENGEGLLTVKDDGGGIKSAARKRSGGIGLQVMDYRANLIGGTLQMESKSGRGVTVICRFPCSPP